MQYITYYIKNFIRWISGWLLFGGLILGGIYISNTFSKDSNTTSTKNIRPTNQTTLDKDDKLIEIRKAYWKNGNLKSETPYKKHYGIGYKKLKTTLTPHGISKEYYEDGTLKIEDPYIDGERTGELKFYDNNGTLEAVVTYKDSKKHGEKVFYYSDGTVMDTEYYRNGVKVATPLE